MELAEDVFGVLRVGILEIGHDGRWPGRDLWGLLDLDVALGGEEARAVVTRVVVADRQLLVPDGGRPALLLARLGLLGVVEGDFLGGLLVGQPLPVQDDAVGRKKAGIKFCFANKTMCNKAYILGTTVRPIVLWWTICR